jgi:hypothetical protein
MLSLRGQRTKDADNKLEYPVLPKGGLEYTPLYCIKPPIIGEIAAIPNAEGFNAIINDKLIVQVGNTIVNDLAPYKSILGNRFKDISAGTATDGVQHISEMEAFCERAPLSILAYAEREENDFSFFLPSGLTGGTTTTYNDVFEDINNYDWTSKAISGMEFLLNKGACFEVINGSNGSIQVKPIFITLVKTKYLKYVKLCYLTGREPNPEVFEIWECPEFDVVNSKYNYLRLQYKNRLGKVDKEDERKFNNYQIKRDILNELFVTITIPEGVRTLAGINNWIDQTVSDCLAHLKVSKDLENTANVELSF